MKIGLVRHFKVEITTKAIMTTEEFSDWNKEYDVAHIQDYYKEPHHLDWSKCYSSDLLRARETAAYIYDGEIVETELLREVPMLPFSKRRMKLPSVIWFSFSRLAWRINQKSQLEGYDQTMQRMHAFFDGRLRGCTEDILIVSHGFYLRLFVQMLKDEGFIGANVNRFKNGELYIFEKI